MDDVKVGGVAVLAEGDGCDGPALASVGDGVPGFRPVVEGEEFLIGHAVLHGHNDGCLSCGAVGVGAG